MTTVTDAETRILCAGDRCDRCGAQAMLAAEFDGLSGPTELLFCAHHANASMPKIKGHITLVHQRAVLADGKVTAKS